MSTLSAQINKTGQLLTVGGGVGVYSHLNFVFKWKTGFHTKNSEKCVLPSKMYLRGNLHNHEKLDVIERNDILGFYEIQNRRGKQYYAVSNNCFSPLGGFHVKTC